MTHFPNRQALVEYGFAMQTPDCIEVPLPISDAQYPEFHSSQVYFGTPYETSANQAQKAVSIRLCSHREGFPSMDAPFQLFHRDLVARVAFEVASPCEKARLRTDPVVRRNNQCFDATIARLREICTSTLNRLRADDAIDSKIDNRAQLYISG
ncbi:hypothetical protein Slin14017_G023120 [Septoria linicola]|nr:hypothetical protein Slin14017_G023120 [Septoria linicola]